MVMLFLVFNILDDGRAVFCAVGKRRIAIAPAVEMREPIFMPLDPPRALLLDDLHEGREC